MTIKQKIDLKKRIYNKAVELIELRINSSSAAMQNAQLAANEEEKSSAGDKYETSRAMSHLEKDMYAKQLEENKKDLAMLRSINCDRVYHVAVTGALIDCGECSFFIATGLGKISFEGQSIFLLSPNAPLAKLFYNKKQGDTIQFNNKEIAIVTVY